MSGWLVATDGGPTALAYVVGWGGAILTAWALLRLQQVGFGWRNGGRHRCGHVEPGVYHEILGRRCPRCGETSGWKAVAYRATFFATEVRSTPAKED